MHILTSCHECVSRAIENKGMPSGFYAELTDGGCLSIVCPNGHNVLTSIQNMDFELLFDLAGMALLDGYSREAVGGFAVSVERAQETYVRCKFHKDTQRNDFFDKIWRIVSKQSERQLGAFVFMWGTYEGTEPPHFSQEEVKFRNECIHKGKIPKYKEALIYGQSALEMIEEIVSVLLKDGPDKILDDHFRRVIHGDIGTSMQKGKMVSTACLPSMIAPWNKERNISKPLSERLVELSQYRQWLWAKSAISV